MVDLPQSGFSDRIRVFESPGSERILKEVAV